MNIKQIKEMLNNRKQSLNTIISHAETSGDMEQYLKLKTELDEIETTLSELSNEL